MIFNVQEHQLHLSDLQIDYITFGKGAKTLIMMQGLNTRGVRGTGFLLAYLYRIFAKDYRVYLFDRREDVREGVTVRDFASDMASAMDALEIAHADVFGVSQGGMIAQYLAIERPDLVNKIVLAVTLSKNNDTVIKVIEHWVELAERGELKHLIKDIAQKMYSEKHLARYQLFLPLLTILQKPKDVQRFIILAKACLTCNTYDDLDKIRCPVFVIGGGLDKVVTGKATEEIADKLGCRLYIYSHLGHAAYEEAKDFNRRVYDFLMESKEPVNHHQ